jgi:hypothetical protein
MTERYGFSFGEDDPASRRGPGVTGQRGDEEPESPQRADVREIDLAEEDEDERDLADAEAAERVERLREADREERDGQATALFPPVEDDAEESDDDEADDDEAAAEAPEPYEVGAPAPPATYQAAGDSGDQDEDEEEVAASRPDGAATVDISGPDDEEAEEEEPAPGIALAPATPLPRSGEADETAAAEAEGGHGEAAAAGARRVVLQADATPALRSGALLATDAEAVRRQFLDIQAGFVDEPRQAVEQAGELVEALHQKVLESLDAEREQLDEAIAGDEPSTEDLRVALRAYRAYVDRLLGLHL